MFLYKIIGAALLILTGALTGQSLCRRREAGLAITEGYIALIRYMKNQIDCFIMPIDKILASCGEQMLEACGASVDVRSFGELIEAGGSSIPPQVAELLVKFSGELGAGYRDAQLKLCDYYIGMLSSERDKLSADLPRRRRVIMTLCICAPAGAALILL